MDVRDFSAWIREAKIARIIRKAENYAASLLPHRESKEVNDEIKKLELNLYETEHDDEIDKAEREYKEYLEKKKKRRK